MWDVNALTRSPSGYLSVRRFAQVMTPSPVEAAEWAREQIAKAEVTVLSVLVTFGEAGEPFYYRDHTVDGRKVSPAQLLV
jgi:hypothetical protein